MLTRCDEAVMFQILKQRRLDNGTVHKFAAWNILLTHKFAACNTLLIPPGSIILLRFVVLFSNFSLVNTNMSLFIILSCPEYDSKVEVSHTLLF